MQLVPVAHLRRHLTVIFQTLCEEDVVGEFVEELHEVAVLAVDLAFVEIAEGHFHLIGLPYVTGFYKFFVIHIYSSFVVQRYK